MPKAGLLARIIETLSSAIAGEVLDKRLREYATRFIQRVMKKLMLMVAGFVIALIGSMFLFLAFGRYLNEILRSTWIGWGVVGLVMLVIGLTTYTVSRR